MADPPGYYGIGVAFFDFDDDGRLDLFVANDSSPNYLYRNRGDGTFQDVSFASGAAFNEAGQEQAHMGVAVGDYDGDGRLDLFVTNFENDANILYHNDGGGLFSETTYPAGVGNASVPFVSWGTNFLDYDNDAWPDLFVANGHVYPWVDELDWNTSYVQRPLLFRNLKGRFAEVGRGGGDGLGATRSMRGSATGDLDNDGDVDLVMNVIDGEPLLLRNDGGNRAGHWLTVRLVGDPARRCPRDATGSQVFLTAGGDPPAGRRGERPERDVPVRPAGALRPGRGHARGPARGPLGQRAHGRVRRPGRRHRDPDRPGPGRGASGAGAPRNPGPLIRRRPGIPEKPRRARIAGTMRLALPFALLASLGSLAAASDSAVVPDRVTPLFNGKDLSGWEADVPARDTDKNAPDSFVVRDGMLVSLGKPEGHLVTTQAYRDYRLVVEYRFPGKGGNCGVLVHASTPRALYKMFPQSIEVQMNSGDAGDFWCIQENIEVPDMETRRPRKAGEKWGGAEGDARRILNLTDGSEKPLGEWNTMVIEARGRTVKVWVNGDLVNDGFDSTADQGKIAIQAEGTEVEFRKVEIGPLPPASK